MPSTPMLSATQSEQLAESGAERAVTLAVGSPRNAAGGGRRSTIRR
jgi:hypothetical protein